MNVKGMRVITGKYKGREIKMPKDIRPTQNRIREALFNILRDIEELSFLDLFAGSGAIGFEALSQGVERVMFVENNRTCAQAIEANLSVISSSNWEVICMDADRAIERMHQRGIKFNIVFLDPPYRQDLAKKTLKTLSQYDIVASTGFVVCQHFKREILPDDIGSLRLIKQAKYGSSYLSFYQKT